MMAIGHGLVTGIEGCTGTAGFGCSCGCGDALGSDAAWGTDAGAGAGGSILCCFSCSITKKPNFSPP